MKRTVAWVLVLALLLCCCGCAARQGDIVWHEKDSKFVDYTVKGDEITFRYSICLENKSNEDQSMVLSAKFKKDELAGWFESEDEFLIGCNGQGKALRTAIKAGEKKNIVYSFSGQFAGGKVSDDLSFPEEILFTIGE